MTGEQHIDYEALDQEAKRGLVRRVLAQVAGLGRLPGEHHFYIAFDTRAPGVVVSKRLKQKYPEEMTIVLQYQFSNLTVGDDRFEVTLSFGNVPERLTVPLHAVRVFFDPSVPFGIQFENSDFVREASNETAPRDADAVEAERPGTLGSTRGKANGSRRPERVREVDEERPTVASAADAGGEAAGTAAQRRQTGRPKLVRATPDEAANDAKVVQLDKFRKR
jgi:hypothetical protein